MGSTKEEPTEVTTTNKTLHLSRGSLLHQLILKPVTTHAYLTPKGGLLVEYATFKKNNSSSYSFWSFSLDWHCLVRCEHSVLPVLEEGSFPHYAKNKQNTTIRHSIWRVYLVSGRSGDSGNKHALPSSSISFIWGLLSLDTLGNSYRWLFHLQFNSACNDKQVVSTSMHIWKLKTEYILTHFQNKNCFQSNNTE